MTDKTPDIDPFTLLDAPASDNVPDDTPDSTDDLDAPVEESEETEKAEPKKKTRQAKPKKAESKKSVSFRDVDYDKFPLSAISGQVSATISRNDSAVPVLNVSLRGWVGLPPLSVVADGGIDDIRAVLDELERQAKA